MCARHIARGQLGELPVSARMSQGEFEVPVCIYPRNLHIGVARPNRLPRTVHVSSMPKTCSEYQSYE
ncbi:hypothetical protein J1N35_006936 [Gossypium stocksii]|uniref:Uncharacterized protein n=1 Tax=Gossypium stocksii TaxID=47602 RepID=A0A9D3W6K8_9ROSI|nr:hypothetical protein J1N35_006936 [Gossypium stocksii]